MSGVDNLAKLLLAFLGVVGGVALFQLGSPIAPLILLPGVIAGAARIQAHCDFPRWPVESARRIELWPLVQVPAGAALTLVSLMLTTSVAAGRYFQTAADPQVASRVEGLLGGALGILLTGLFTLLAGKEGAKLGAAHAFKAAMRTLRFPPGSKGHQAQYRPSIDDIAGDIGWDFAGRKLRAQVAAGQLHQARPGG